MGGLYVHIPFCVKKCGYCDFYSVPVHSSSIEPYIQALLVECRSYPGFSFDTLYLGGGTPSLLGPDNLVSLINGLGKAFDLSGLVEASIEVNPESTTAELLDTARSVGINRISIGVQSLSKPELVSVGRVHTAEQAVKAVSLAKEMDFRSVSADLIIGLPGQTWKTLKNSLDTLIGLGVSHLSLYCLSLEHDTPLALKPPADLPSDDMQADLYDMISFRLKKYAFRHYEISNFAVSGHECLHNMNYWRGGEYLGLGPAAASHLSGRRFKNRPDLHAYLENPAHVVEDEEYLVSKDKAAEEAMLRLRLMEEGLNPNDLIERFGSEDVAGLIERLEEIAGSGDLLFDGNTYRLPASKVLTSNRIFARVLSE